jgi:hypothetical protein
MAHLRNAPHWQRIIKGMGAIRRKPAAREAAAFGPKPRKARPYEFVLEALGAGCTTRPMFGALAVYAGPRIVMILRDKPAAPVNNGVWLATIEDHHDSLRAEFPGMQSIPEFGGGLTGWQMLAASAADFEESALRACELILARDPRIGKIPKARRGGSKTAKSSV